MSLYNLFMGANPAAGILLSALGIDYNKIERFRDCSLEKRDDKIVIHILCRTGGGNRDDFPNKILTSHPAYISDEDDDFDSTYAHYYFTIPQTMIDEMKAEGLKPEQFIDNESLKEKFDHVVEEINRWKKK